MPKLTKEFLEKVNNKYQEYVDDVNKDEILQELEKKYDGQLINVDDMENDELAVDLFAISCAMTKDNFLNISKMGPLLQKYGWKENTTAMMLMSNPDNLDKIEEIEDGHFTYKLEEDEDALEENIEKSNISKSEKVNKIYTKSFLIDAIDNLEEGNDIEQLINYENSQLNTNKPLYENIEGEIKMMNVSTSANSTLAQDKNDANKLFNYYVALKDRSEKRSWADVFKHPWNTFREWIAKRSVINELNKRTNITESQLDTLDKMVREKKVPENYAGFNDNGEYKESKTNDREDEYLESSIEETNKKDLSSIADDTSLDESKVSMSNSYQKQQSKDLDKSFN